MTSGLRLLSPLPPETEGIVRAVMDCAFAVHRSLGPGFARSSTFAHFVSNWMPRDSIRG